MDFEFIKKQALLEISEKSKNISQCKVLAGFDGFIDKIIHPVDKRMGEGTEFTRIETINDFGNRIKAASGKSCNIEFYPCIEKLGGNGTIFAEAILSLGCQTRYIGSLGKPINPIFADFAKKTKAISLCEPAITHAVEFLDGKILFGTMLSLSEVTYKNILNTIGKEQFIKIIDTADLLASMNWTMLPKMTTVLKGLLEEILPVCTNKNRYFFFDLADPEKRSGNDICEVLEIISRFQEFGCVILSLNLKEAQKVHENLMYAKRSEDKDGLKQIAREIRMQLDINTVVIHPCDSAVCSTGKGDFFIKGPYTSKPFITTGAGDHFNAGFAAAQLLEFSPISSLVLASCNSGYYVRTGKSASFADIDKFIKNWTD